MTILVNGHVLETEVKPSEFVRKIIAQCRYKSDSEHSVVMNKDMLFAIRFKKLYVIL